jgi:hypothetical protein
MPPVSVADLARDGRIEAVFPDLNAAWSRLDEAKTHLASSAALAKTDPSLSYVALYDAARKAITAHMQAHGYRVANRPGAHHAVGLYAEATLAIGVAGPHVRAFDRMRQVRNRSEYAQHPITKRLLTTDLEHAKAVVAAVEHALPPRQAPP